MKRTLPRSQSHWANRYSTSESSDAIPRAHDLHTLASQVSRVMVIPGTIINTTVIVPSPVILGVVLPVSVTVRQTGPGPLCCTACSWTNVSLSNKMQSNMKALLGSVLSNSLWPRSLTLCSPPGSSVHGVLQARSWSGLSSPSPGDLPDPGIKPWSALQADSLPSEPPRDWKY